MVVTDDAGSADLERLWANLRSELVERRGRYSWPPGCTFDESLQLRAHLEQCIQRDLLEDGRLCFPTFQKVMYWGFGKVPGAVTDADLADASAASYSPLKEGRLADAVQALCALPRVGVSRATKLLALSDQESFGIYDSSAAHSLNRVAGKEVVPEPPAQGSSGRRHSAVALANGFAEYTRILRALRDLAAADPDLATEFRAVSDIEIALFEPG